jgi:hypothetical protein
MLNSYLQQAQQLLSDLRQQTVNPAFLVRYINTARGQLAGEGLCIRAFGTMQAVVGQRTYNFSALNLGPPLSTGIQGAININTIWYNVGSGVQWIVPRSWEWFGLYHLNNVVPSSGPPQVWSQYGQGAAPPPSGSKLGGSIYLDPLPDLTYTLNCDCTCYPVSLASDNDVEAIPYLWTDAVPYFAVYLALLSQQGSTSAQAAEEMLKLYGVFVNRARNAANPMQLGTIYQQSQNLFRQAKIGNGQAAPTQQGGP